MNNTTMGSTGATKRKVGKDWLRWETLGIPVATLALGAFFTFMSPAFLSSGNLLNVAQQSAGVALAAWGMTVVIISGGIDLSVGSVAALASVVGVDVMIKRGTLPGVVVMIAIGIAMGAFNGFVISKLKIPPFIGTLAMQSIARGAAMTYTGAVPIFGLESAFISWLSNGALLGIPANVVVALLGLLLTWVLLNRTKFGVYTYAIGSNEVATRWAGIRVDLYKILIYTYAGLMWGLSALVLTSRVNSGQPLLGQNLEQKAIAAACIGGTSMMGGVGTLTGTLWGVVLVGVLNNGLNLLGVSSLVQLIITGITILVAVLVSVWRQKKQ